MMAMPRAASQRRRSPVVVPRRSRVASPPEPFARLRPSAAAERRCVARPSAFSLPRRVLAFTRCLRRPRAADLNPPLLLRHAAHRCHAASRAVLPSKLSRAVPRPSLLPAGRVDHHRELRDRALRSPPAAYAWRIA
ncbi:hypothetical protein Scep_004720 [Stephania cephalantha]|uniref:Uncharacterized protein n=1 Tax=Stephania cephalantha TaxID=152367 RepID=A0AAP0KT71_9MAGN